MIDSGLIQPNLNIIKEHLHNYVMKKDKVNQFEGTAYEKMVIDFMQADDKDDQAMHKLAEELTSKIQQIDYTMVNLLGPKIQASFQNYEPNFKDAKTKEEEEAP